MHHIVRERACSIGRRARPSCRLHCCRTGASVTNHVAVAGYLYYNLAVNTGRFRFLTLSLCLMLTAGALFGQASWMTGRSNPEDLQIQLVTIEPGDELYTWWGHSALIVTDLRLGETRFYNYGLFSFQKENFFTNFAMGRLWFEVDAMPTKPALEAYARRNRSITIQTLNIPPDMRQQIARFVEVNILPENRNYLYDHYYDNCATRIRDILDTASSGALYRHADVRAGTTFRRITRRFSGRYFFADTLLMFLMGRSIDEPITVWETMFLPTELRDTIDDLTIQTADGEREPFVLEQVELYRATGREPIPKAAPRGTPRAFAFGGGLSLIILLLSVLLRHRPAAGRTYFGVLSAFAGLLIGLPGMTLALMSLFTNHTVTYWNENLVSANPLTFLALPLGIFTAAGFNRVGRFTAWLWVFLAGLTVLYIAAKAVGGLFAGPFGAPFSFDFQNNMQIIALLAPIIAGIAFSGRKYLVKTI